MLLKHVIIVIFSCGLAACASTGSEDAGGQEGAVSRSSDCIHEPSIRGYTVLDEQNLIVSASNKRAYHVVLFRRAYGLDSSWGIAFNSPTSRICEGFSEIIFRGHMNGESIRISSIRALTPEEEDDLMIRFGKKEPEIKQTPVPREVEGAEVEELDPKGDE